MFRRVVVLPPPGSSINNRALRVRALPIAQFSRRRSSSETIGKDCSCSRGLGRRVVETLPSASLVLPISLSSCTTARLWSTPCHRAFRRWPQTLETGPATTCLVWMLLRKRRSMRFFCRTLTTRWRSIRVSASPTRVQDLTATRLSGRLRSRRHCCCLAVAFWVRLGCSIAGYPVRTTSRNKQFLSMFLPTGGYPQAGV